MNNNEFCLVKQVDHFDVNDCLYDPNFDVSTMLEKYSISTCEINRKEKKHIEKKDLDCVVCGARAYGYNFDQITCESCKGRLKFDFLFIYSFVLAFFRRNALKNLNNFQCRFDRNCQITIENRRHCTDCRIRKCFAVGMKKEWIQSEEEKTTKRIRLEISRKMKQTQIFIHKQPSTFPSIVLLNSIHRTQLNNLTHCYEQYTGEPTISNYSPPKELLCLRLCDFYNRKKPVIVNFVSFFKHLPEFQQLHIDDQVLLIKQNIHFLLPVNYALLKTPNHSQFRYTYVQTIDCVNNINLHSLYQSLSNSFVSLVTTDPLIIKLLCITLFFTPNLQYTNIDRIEYKRLEYIKEVQSNYVELLWLYMLEKFGEKQARNLFVNMIMKYLNIQVMIDKINQIIRLNNDIQYIDELMKSILQLT
ncbi:hypothetical protein I4U23_029504 [Adineta vaga]|nr:hypothetical protein I4U23_029504 [Adineta vaga]